MKKLIITIALSCVVFGWVVSRPYADKPNNTRKVIASWYGDECAGKPTASGEIYDPNQLTAAMWDVPFDTLVRVQLGPATNTVTVRINDRGPAKRLKRGIDLSRKSFSQIADLDAGLITVELTVLK